MTATMLVGTAMTATVAASGGSCRASRHGNRLGYRHTASHLDFLLHLNGNADGVGLRLLDRHSLVDGDRLGFRLLLGHQDVTSHFTLTFFGLVLGDLKRFLTFFGATGSDFNLLRSRLGLPIAFLHLAGTGIGLAFGHGDLASLCFRTHDCHFVRIRNAFDFPLTNRNGYFLFDDIRHPHAACDNYLIGTTTAID